MGVSVEGLSTSGCPVDMSVGDYLDCSLMDDGLVHCGRHHSLGRWLAPDCVRKLVKSESASPPYLCVHFSMFLTMGMA